jgi:hypothetical protein
MDIHWRRPRLEESSSAIEEVECSKNKRKLLGY